MIEVDTNQLDKFIRKLQGTVDESIPRRLRRFIQNIINDTLEIMDYPPPAPGRANRAPPYPYYQRGVGLINRKGQVLYTSGNLGGNWQQSISVSGDEVVGNISNDATGTWAGGWGDRVYPSYVLGVPFHPDDFLRQAWFHTNPPDGSGRWPSALLTAQALAGEDVQVSVKGRDSLERTVQDIIAEIDKGV